MIAPTQMNLDFGPEHAPAGPVAEPLNLEDALVQLKYIARRASDDATYILQFPGQGLASNLLYTISRELNEVCNGILLHQSKKGIH